MKFFEKKKYFLPLLSNLKTQKEQGNAIFCCNYTSEGKFLILLCYGNKIFEVSQEGNLSLILKDEDVFFNWSDYRIKTELLKYQGKVLNPQGFIMTVSENVRHLANQRNLSFETTKAILSFLFKFDPYFFEANPSATVLDKEPNLWFD